MSIFEQLKAQAFTYVPLFGVFKIRYVSSFALSGIFFVSCINLYSETIPAKLMHPHQIAQSYVLFYRGGTYPGKTLEEACSGIGLPASTEPNAYYCGSIFQNIRVAPVLICSDGSIKNSGTAVCENPAIPTCPNGSWTLDTVKNTCSRPNFSCIINTDLVSEEKLLAAMAYGEASTLDDYEEMAGIASAIIRRRNAAHLSTVNELVKKQPNFSYVISDLNQRYIKLMCSESDELFKKAYTAADNALDDGIDYANGGCFWDGYDLKTGGKSSYRYVKGFRYSDPSHNIFSVSEPPHKLKKGKYGYFDNMYVSTAAHGKTIFWKVDEQFLKAKGKSQCK